MALNKRNPLRKVPRDIKARYIKSLRRRISLVKAAEIQTLEKMFNKTGKVSVKRYSLSDWDELYKQRRGLENMLKLVRGKNR